jgi:hypothetical protein
MFSTLLCLPYLPCNLEAQLHNFKEKVIIKEGKRIVFEVKVSDQHT